MIGKRGITFTAVIASAVLLQSCDKDVCRDCYVIRSSLCTYTDTVLRPYLIPADTVQTYRSCDKAAEFKDDKFKEVKYEYYTASIYYPEHQVHVAVTELYVCPEKTN
ncbi:MAG: hypothetical protein JSS90_07580 [Bacteroidetes bacterium]|nr:hypothetical protein [Bacteroidota bacterium]